LRINSEKQKLLLEYLISSTEVFSLCLAIISDEYFNPELKAAVTFIKKYYDDYNATPNSEQIKVETGIELNEKQITMDQIKYCTTEIQSFCRFKALSNAIIDASDIILSENEDEYDGIPDLIRQALLLSINDGLGLDFFNDNVIERIEKRHEKKLMLPTGFTQFDNKLDGGPERGTLTIFLAPSGGGKSLSLANFGLEYYLQGLNVVYFTFELSQDLLDERYLYMLTSLPKTEVYHKREDVSKIVSSLNNGDGRLTISYMAPNETKTNHIKAYLKEYELKYKCMPDVICVDYIDLLSPNKKISLENVFQKEKYASEDLRHLCIEYNILGMTASQLNRSALEAESVGHQHIAGGISKIYTADNVVSINLSDAMKTKGECCMEWLKTRSSDGVGKFTYLKYDGGTLRFSNKEVDKSKGFKVKEKKIDINKTVGKDSKPGNKLDSLIDLMPDEY